MAKQQTEALYRGERIIQVDNPQPSVKCYGFDMPKVFIVRDEFDTECLPTVQQTFWTPLDAAAAINFRDTIGPDIASAKWPTSWQYEFNHALAMRANFDIVFHGLKKIRKALREAKDFDENPADEIKGILDWIDTNSRNPRTIG